MLSALFVMLNAVKHLAFNFIHERTNCEILQRRALQDDKRGGARGDKEGVLGVTKGGVLGVAKEGVLGVAKGGVLGVTKEEDSVCR